MKIREQLKKGPLLFDGSMGTYYSMKNHVSGSGCEMANIEAPETIAAIHDEYLAEGAMAIKTNTFSANRQMYGEDPGLVEKIIRQGFAIATEAAKPYGAHVFADIGPVTGMSSKEAAEEYIYVAEQFIQCGAEQFLFETNAGSEGLADAAKYIREKVEDAFLIASFAVQPDGYTRDGVYGGELLVEMQESGLFDAVGFNCVCGARHLLELEETMAEKGTFEDMTLSLMPNAGYPVVISNRTFYDSDPVYFAELVGDMAEKGASILGGCCGTTPRHIGEIRRVLAQRHITEVPRRKKSAATKGVEAPTDPFWEKLKKGEKVVAVELDPPKDISVDKFMQGCQELQEAKTDIITIADCPVGRARMDSSMLACKVKRELGQETLPHMTCRDRNLNAIKALLLGLYAENIHNVLLITGDPLPTAERDEVKIVYQFNSRKLAGYVRSLGENTLPSPFRVFGALNINASNFDMQLNLAKEKVKKGMVGFLTQPVLSEQAKLNLKRAHEELDAYILGGLFPVVSERNAIFLNNEVNGINVSEEIIDMYRGKERDEAEEIAYNLTVKTAEEIKDYVDGYYVMTPFSRTALVSRIVDRIHQL